MYTTGDESGGLSTGFQLCCLTEDVRDGIGKRETTTTVFLEITRAFDIVWYVVIIYKLSVLVVNPSVVRLVRNYLGRLFTTRVEGCHSRSRRVGSEVSRDSLLGTELPTSCIYDLPKTHDVELAVYAEYTALYTKFVASRLQTAVDSVE